jgi:hypothetical protein
MNPAFSFSTPQVGLLVKRARNLGKGRDLLLQREKGTGYAFNFAYISA